MPTRKAYGYQISKMCEAFALAGLETELWLPEKEGQDREELFSYYGVKKNFRIKVLRGTDYLKYYPYLGKLSFWLKSIIFLLKLAFMKPEAGAIIFSRNPEIAWLFSLKGYKTVYEAHSWPRSKNFLFMFFIKKVGLIITITEGIKKVFINNGFSRCGIVVLSDGVDMEEFDINMERKEARNKLDLPRFNKIIVYSGHLYKWKGVDTLIDAVHGLKDEALLYIVGGTDEDIKLYKEKYRERKNIIFAGHKPHKEIPVWLKAADILVLPNSGKDVVSSHYTSPMKLFEYMASRRPIVASDLPSIREILNEKNAIFAEADNPQSLAGGIKEVLKNEDFAKQIAKNAYHDVKNYTWRNRAIKARELLG